MELNVLKHKLKICSIPKNSKSKGSNGYSAITQFTHSLIKCAFFKETGCSFFSFTETCDDYSVVVDEKGFKDLPDNEVLHIVPSVWVPLTVSVGAFADSQAVGISKIAKSLIIPLADSGISVYCLSSFQNDFVLLREEDLEKAMQCLAGQYTIYRETEKEVLPVEVEPCLGPENMYKDGAPRPITHEYTSPKNKFYLTSYNYGDLSKIALPLIEAMFYSESMELPSEDHERFFSFSVVDEDVTIVLDDTTLRKFDNCLFVDEECWRMVKIGDMPEGLGFVQCGVVAQMSEPIADANISEYYLSSYYYGHTLVPETSVDEVLRLLQKRKKSQATSENT